jgi:hypothetical protein
MSPTAIKQGQPSAAQHAEMSNVPNFTSVFVQNLYGRYLALLKKLRPPYIPADPNNHRHLFLSQLESELRVQDRALEEHLAKVTGSMSRSGASDLVGARKLVFAWSARLAHVLDQELVKVSGREAVHGVAFPATSAYSYSAQGLGLDHIMSQAPFQAVSDAMRYCSIGSACVCVYRP